ncbi:MAG: hypothetical protein WB676_27930 [Bryobacteraceae bacterium]
MSEYLLVPTNIQAFLVGKSSEEDIYDLVLVPRDKDELLGWYFESRNFFAFDQQSKMKALEQGIHLHWALPAALSHSRHYRRDNRDVHEEPYIPNRWLVVRMWRSEENQDISSRAWVIESDFLSDEKQPDSTAFLIQSPSLEVKFAGHKESLEDWNEETTKYRFDLKSSGWGDPSFSSYYPACRGVLGFHDDLLDVNDGDLLTYQVLGWYSEPEKDPLYQGKDPNLKNSKKILRELFWSCSEPKSGSLPQRTLCHGSVVGIKWNKEAFYEKVFDGSKAEIAIGSSVDDAFAALLTKDEQQQQVLRAFYYGRADDVNNEYQLAELLHHQSFNTIPGGRRWSLESPEQSSAKNSTRPLVSAKVLADLAELNQAQQRLDKREREIESYRWQLFAGWVTWIMQRGRNPADLNPGMQQLRDAESGLHALKNEVTDWKTKVTQALKTDESEMQLTESTMPPFYFAKDPVVVLKGKGVTGIDRTSPRRPDKDKDDERVLLLHCRHTDEIVSQVSLGARAGNVKADSLESYFPGNVGPAIGELARKLAQESLLIDPNYLDSIAAKDDPIYPAVKKLQKTLDQRSDSVEWKGTPPDPLSVTRWLGADPPYENQNPWLPVFLLWQAEWAYADAKDSGMTEALKGWTLAANPLAGDLAPETQQRMVRQNRLTLESATLVSVASGQQLAEKLKIFALSQKLTARDLSKVRDTTVLSQSLGGFNELLLRQTMGLFLPPLKPKERDAAVIDDEIWNALGRAPQALMPTPSGRFLPVRSGDLTFVNLCAVDTFGQIWEPVERSSGCPITASAAVRPGQGDDSNARFSPRLAQPARLHFDWHVDSKDASACGPLCGWLVPNFLDRSFSVFDASGVPLGALESVLNAFGEKTSESEVKFRWRSAPGSDVKPAGIANSHLRRLVTLIASDVAQLGKLEGDNHFTVDEGRAFLELVEIILRKREERRPLDNPRLAVLLGRPLALLQVSLKFELQGLPAGYFKTVSPWRFETDGLEGLRVRVELGGIDLPPDGLVGYLDEKASTFFATSGATRRVKNSPRIQYSQPLEVSAVDQPKILTLLLDATARVHASTGILPRCSIELPPEIAKQIRRIEHIYFKAAPVLGARPEEKAPMYMPHPSDAFGRWSWSTRPALGWREIQPADDRASFPDDLVLCEGWLKLNLRSGELGAGKETD